MLNRPEAYVCLGKGSGGGSEKKIKGGLVHYTAATNHLAKSAKIAVGSDLETEWRTYGVLVRTAISFVYYSLYRGKVEREFESKNYLEMCNQYLTLYFPCLYLNFWGNKIFQEWIRLYQAWRIIITIIISSIILHISFNTFFLMLK